jgi:hypothetical protein
MVKGDPGETVDLGTITDMAEAVIAAHWIPCPHDNHITETNWDQTLIHRTCQQCGAGHIIKPEDTDG